MATAKMEIGNQIKYCLAGLIHLGQHESETKQHIARDLIERNAYSARAVVSNRMVTVVDQSVVALPPSLPPAASRTCAQRPSLTRKPKSGEERGDRRDWHDEENARPLIRMCSTGLRHETSLSTPH